MKGATYHNEVRFIICIVKEWPLKQGYLIDNDKMA